MKNQKVVLLVLLGIIVFMAALTVVAMFGSTIYMNNAAVYAKDHLDQVPPTTPIPGAVPYPDPPVRVDALAHYWDANAVEVQITRLYKTARHNEAQYTITRFYQAGLGGWQVVPAPASFWGTPTTTDGVRVTFSHPLRNQAIVTDLVASIDPALAAACDQWQCPTDMPPVHITLTGDTDSPTDPATYPAPQYTGVPLNYNANLDFQSAWEATAIRLLAAQLNRPPADAEAEIQRQGLYTAP
jgi:hypothetical protein